MHQTALTREDEASADPLTIGEGIAKRMTEPSTVKNLLGVVSTEHGSGPKSLTSRKMKNCREG